MSVSVQGGAAATIDSSIIRNPSGSWDLNKNIATAPRLWRLSPVTLPQIRYYNFNGIPCAHVLELGVFNCAYETPIKVGDSEILADWQEISPALFTSLRRHGLSNLRSADYPLALPPSI